MAVVDVQFSRPSTRQEKLAGEQVHLNFAPLATAVVDNPVHSDGRSLRRACEVNFAGWLYAGFVSQLNMPHLMGYEERARELGFGVLVQD
jgi:hypothetical protein